MSVFSERVKKILDEKKLTQKQLSRISNVSESSLCRYMRGDIEPRIDIVTNIAKALATTEAFLLGNSNVNEEENPKLAIRDILARNRNIISDKDRAEIIDMLYGRFNDK